MKLIVTYCAKSKQLSPDLLPAYQRYISNRIRHTHDAAKIGGLNFAILSGRFGLIKNDHLIPYYDHLLQEDEMPLMVTKTADTLKAWKVTHITWYSLPDELDQYVWRYRAVITRASEIAECRLDTVELLEE